MSESPQGPLLVVVGPTASGKTELACDLAERLKGEVVSADSVQVYRHFEIGTGKPSPSERARVPHHLIDIIEPADEMDAGRWVDLAEAEIAALESRGRTPVVCGGTFLWVRALLFGLAKVPAGDASIRAVHKQRAESEGRAALHAELARVDPTSAARLAPNDFVRVSRALEVFELTGTPLSTWQAHHGFRAPKRPFRLVGVARERDDLDQRIRRRAVAMFEAGWAQEVTRLIEQGFGETRAMGSVGYKQVHDHITSAATQSDSELIDAVVRATRVFARRQRTWLRDQPVEWVRAASEVR